MIVILFAVTIRPVIYAHRRVTCKEEKSDGSGGTPPTNPNSGLTNSP